MRLNHLLLTAAGLMAFAAPAHAVMEDYPSIKLQGLDKSVGRTVTFEAKVGSTIQYGPLYIKIHACRKAPPIEAPESAAFLQIWEVPPGAQKSEWVFSGWMFASSPALSAMDHAVYDVWVLDCTGREEPNEEAQAAETNEETSQEGLPAANAQNPVENEAEPRPVTEEAIPVDGEADMSGDDPVVMPDTQTPVPEGQAPFDPYAPVPQPGQPMDQVPAQQEPYYDPNAAYQPPVQQQPVPAPLPTVQDPATEGVYSPSQGRIVPVNPQNPYGQY